MTVWPLQNVALYYAPYNRVYISQRVSAAYCIWLIYIISLICIPIFLAYASGNLWVKESFYREQPLVRFQHNFVYAVQSETSSSFYSTDAKLNELNLPRLKVPDVRYSELDKDVDGIPDELVLKCVMPILNGEDLPKRVLLLGTFSYQLQETVRLSMKGLIALDESSGVPASGITLKSTLHFHQKMPLKSLPEPRTVYDTDPLKFEWHSNYAYSKLNPFAFSNLLEAYSNRNETIRALPITPAIWNYQSQDKFVLNIHLQIPKQIVYYIPSALAELKNGWIHFASFLFPMYLILQSILKFIYTNQIVQTYCCSQLPYMNKQD